MQEYFLSTMTSKFLKLVKLGAAIGGAILLTTLSACFLLLEKPTSIAPAPETVEDAAFTETAVWPANILTEAFLVPDSEYAFSKLQYLLNLEEGYCLVYSQDASHDSVFSYIEALQDSGVSTKYLNYSHNNAFRYINYWGVSGDVALSISQSDSSCSFYFAYAD